METELPPRTDAGSLPSAQQAPGAHVSRPEQPAETDRGRVVRPSLTRVRVFAEADVPRIVDLFDRVFPNHGWRSRSACEQYFHRMYFGNPWREVALPSFVAEVGRRLVGFYGIVGRPMLFRGRPIRVAVTCNAMVDPEHRRSLVALELVKANLAGSQDLTLADGATAESARFWRGIGGNVPLVYNLHWTRLLRPARYVLSLLGDRSGVPAAVTSAAGPFATLVDRVAMRSRPNRFLREHSELREYPLEPSALVAELPNVLRGKALQPVYDVVSVAWLLDQSRERRGFGTLRARQVLDRQHRVLGWYIYYPRPGRVSEVVQVAARDGAYDLVIKRLLVDAWRNGAVAVHGRLEPSCAEELSTRHCWLRREAPATLVHSRDAEIVAAIERGDAFLSRLEGEWWMRFISA